MEVDKNNPNIVDELIVTDYIDHNPPVPDTAPAREGVKQTNAILRQAFSDVEHTIRAQIAEGDRVVTHVTVSATFTGTFLGIPPNGKRASAWLTCRAKIQSYPSFPQVGCVKAFGEPVIGLSVYH